jgi:hypothetical protein
MLLKNLSDMHWQIIKKALSSVEYIKTLTGKTHSLVLSAYIDSFQKVFGMCLLVSFSCDILLTLFVLVVICLVISAVESVVGLFMEEKRLAH